MMDMLHRIRQLLGGDKSQKRRAPEDSVTFDQGTTKKGRLTYSNGLERPTHNGDFYYPTRLDQMDLNRRRTIDAPIQNYRMGHLYAREDERSSAQLPPPRQRQLPGLLKTDFPLTNGGGTHSRRDIGSIGPQGSRNLFSKVPELHPMPRSTSNYFNGSTASNMQNGRSAADNQFFRRAYPAGQQQQASVSDMHEVIPSARSSYSTAPRKFNIPNTLSLKSYLPSSRQIIERQTYELSRENDKKRYSQLLNLIPFYNKPKPNVVDTTNAIPRPEDIIDLANDNDGTTTSNTSSMSTVEPVNSLRTKLENKPIFKDDWLLKLNSEYSNNCLNNAELAKVVKEKTSRAEKKTKDQEEQINDSLRNLKLGSHLFILDDEEEEEEFNDFPALAQDHQQKIINFISGRDTRQVLNTKFSISITRADIQTLSWEPLAWLNDEVINFYMELLGERSKQTENLPKVYGMNTFFLKRLLETGYSAVRRWTRKVDIFSFDIIPIPVHKGIHWCMAIIHLKNKTIRYYDSMGAPNNAVLNALEEYLSAESMDKKQVAFDRSGWVKENMQNIPQQENGSDCGVFSCMFAEFVSRNRPICFSQQHMQYFRMRMIYEICTGQLMAS